MPSQSCKQREMCPLDDAEWNDEPGNVLLFPGGVMTWLGICPDIRSEQHYGTRLVRCFASRPANVPAMLAETAARQPTGEALICGEQRLDWRALEEIAGRVAGALAALGIGTGDRVALLLANSAEFVIALHAVMRLGAIVVPLNIREERPELAYILENCGAKALIYHAGLAAKVPVAAKLPGLRHRIVCGYSDTQQLNFAGLTAGEPISPAFIAEESTAAILYTSGTTGRPKGAMLTHFSIVHAAMIYEACMGLSAADRTVVTVPMSHVTGLTASIAAMLRVGGALLVAPPFKADRASRFRAIG